MATGFKHESGADPIVFPKEMLPLFTHTAPFQPGTAFFYQSDRVPAGMGINAMENMFHDGMKIRKWRIGSGRRDINNIQRGEKRTGVNAED